MRQTSVLLPGKFVHIASNTRPQFAPSLLLRVSRTIGYSRAFFVSDQILMNFSSKDSIFECTSISAADFTLSCYDERDSAPKLSVNSVDEEENEQSNLEENARSVRLTDMPELTGSSDRSLTVLKACVRHDIMEQISLVISELVAIDLKYSELAQISASQGKERMEISIRDPIPGNDDQKRTPLESLHAYTIAELHSQLSSLRVFIQDLDAKYLEVARCVRERIEKLEQCKTELSSEVEHLRRFY